MKSYYDKKCKNYDKLHNHKTFCNNKCRNKYFGGWSFYIKGKTFDEIYGYEKAKKLRDIQSNVMKNKELYNRGKTYEEIWGKKKAKEMKLHQSKLRKGLSWEHRYGEERAKKLIKKLSATMKIERNLPKYKKLASEITRKQWRNKKIREKHIKCLRKVAKEKWEGKNYMERYKDKEKVNDIIGRISESRKGKCCGEDNPAKKLISRKKIKNHWKYYREERVKSMRLGAIKRIERQLKNGSKLSPSVGENEKEILDSLEFKFNTIIERAYKVNGFYLDGYSKDLKIAFEVDEEGHIYKNERDYQRQIEIQKELNCKFVRIQDYENGKI